jgi:tetratricopeptide (TPR) repeat protein
MIKFVIGVFLFLPIILLPTVAQFLNDDGVDTRLMGRNLNHHNNNLIEIKSTPVDLNSRLRWMKHRQEARTFVLRGQLEQARLSYKALLHTKIHSLRQRTIADLYLELGHVFFLLGDSDFARLHFEKAKSYRSQAYQPFVRLAQLEASLGHLDQAKKYFEHALFFNNTHGLSLISAGTLSFACGNIDEGFYWWNLAWGNDDGNIEIDPTSTISWHEKVILSKWMTTHLMNFVSYTPLTSLDPIIYESDQINFNKIQNTIKTDKDWIVGHALHELAIRLQQAGLNVYSEAIWSSLRSDIFSNILTFLPKYATGLVQIIRNEQIDDLNDEFSGAKNIKEEANFMLTEKHMLNGLRDRMIWSTQEIKRIIDLQNDKSITIMDIIMNEKVSYVRVLGTIHNIGEDIKVLRSHLTSRSSPSSTSISLVDRHRIWGEKMVVWGALNLPKYFCLSPFETVPFLIPPKYFISNQYDSRQDIRKRRRVDAKKKWKERRMKNKIKTINNRNKPTTRVGIIYDIDRYGRHQTTIYRHSSEMILNLAKVYDITLFVPRYDMQKWDGSNRDGSENINDNDTKKKRIPRIWQKYINEIIEIPWLHQVTVRKLPELHKEYLKKFTICKKIKEKKKYYINHVKINRTRDDYGTNHKMLAFCDETTEIALPRVDVLLFVAPLFDETSMYLAHTRWAPLQIALSAGSSSTMLGMGVGALDYFLTSDIILSSESHRSFTEQLVRLPYLGSIFPTTITDLPYHAIKGNPPKYQYNNLVMYSKYLYILIPFEEGFDIPPIFDHYILNILKKNDNVHILLADINHDERVISSSSLSRCVLIKRLRSIMSIDKNDGSKSSSKNIISERRRIHHITGLSRSDYLSLVAVVNIVLDPVTDDGGGTERTILPSLETLMIGTPIITLFPDEMKRGWNKVQPTSSVAALIKSIGGNDITKHCVAINEIDYIQKVVLLLNNTTLQMNIRKMIREKTKPWIHMQNKKIKEDFLLFFKKVTQPYTKWRDDILENASVKKQ